MKAVRFYTGAEHIEIRPEPGDAEIVIEVHGLDENGGHVTANIFLPADEARELAAELIEMADRCVLPETLKRSEVPS